MIWGYPYFRKHPCNIKQKALVNGGNLPLSIELPHRQWQWDKARIRHVLTKKNSFILDGSAVLKSSKIRMSTVSTVSTVYWASLSEISKLHVNIWLSSCEHQIFLSEDCHYFRLDPRAKAKKPCNCRWPFVFLPWRLLRIATKVPETNLVANLESPCIMFSKNTWDNPRNVIHLHFTVPAPPFSIRIYWDYWILLRWSKKHEYC